LLDTIAESLHDREALVRAAGVATAQARTTGRMVSLMPVFGVMALRVVDPAGFALLVGTLVGWATLLVSAAMTLVGHVLMRRLAAVEP
jgi:Flp pilus assembly protein TadB